MKIVVDDKIPYIREKMALLADEVVYLSGAEITAADVKDADVAQRDCPAVSMPRQSRKSSNTGIYHVMRRPENRPLIYFY